MYANAAWRPPCARSDQSPALDARASSEPTGGHEGGGYSKDIGGAALRRLVAAAGGHVETMRMLVELGTHMEDTDMLGLTAIHWAARYGHLDAVRCFHPPLLNEISCWSSVAFGISSDSVAANMIDPILSII